MATISRAQLSAEMLRAGRFLGVGVAGLAMDTAIFTLLHGEGASRAVARAGSLVAATGLTWGLNRWLTFHRTGRRPAHEFGRYAAVALCAQGFNYALFLALGALFPAVLPQLLIVASAIAAAAISYTGQRFFTFRPARAPAP
jgi:putative flippase GtrA